MNNIRTMTIACWHDAHVNLDPTNSSTQFEPRGDAPFKVCTRVLLHGVSLPLHPDPLIPTAAAVDDVAMGRGSTELAWRPTVDLCAMLYSAPTATSDWEAPYEEASSSTGAPPEGRVPNRAGCAGWPCWAVCVAVCVAELALMATWP